MKQLAPWSDVIAPHQDVASGRFRQAEFAADLAQVLAGKASPEYQDPVEFFKRTYLTSGTERLLKTALGRVSGQDAQPVIKIKTAFGGGKTHSMLAIYHLLGGEEDAAKLVGIPQLLRKVNLKRLPKASIAVLVGTDLDPSKSKIWKGTKVNTLWGFMAAQLGGKEGYNLVRAADEKGISPMANSLIELFDKFGPCVILIDELVAYIRNIYGVEGLPSGSFDSNLSFIQSLTEAVKRSQNSLLVASIPESDVEIGGSIGKSVLERIDQIFQRLEEVWEPIQAPEAFEIVRRRLFSEITNERARDDVCNTFSKLYNENKSDFPAECREVAYVERMKEAYPIHPEVFDRLYDDWAAMEGFQRTRGVLRLMATVINELWSRGDKSPLIMPHSFPLDSPKVREELLRHLPDVWNTIMDKDIDGERSEPWKVDHENPRFGRYSAARRVSRTIFLGSAPSVSGQRIRGIEDTRIRLGAIEPEEQIAVYNDALGRLLDRSSHLYSRDQRYWFDTQPNLTKTMRDRAAKVDDSSILMEVERRLRRVRDRGDFHAIHVAPLSSDVLDEQEVRLIVLPLKASHKESRAESPALKLAQDILDHRGTAPRQYKNMLIYVAADSELAIGVDQEARQYLAWESILREGDSLNLDAHQRKQTSDNLKRADETIEVRLQETYCWLLVPSQNPAGPLTWNVMRISGGNENYVSKASKKLRASEQLITKWSPALLKIELDKWLWKNENHISTRKLWDYMTTYLYLTRLRDSQVLLDAIRDGIRSKDYFGYATSVDEKGRYLGLSFGIAGASVYLDANSVLLKPETAQSQSHEAQRGSQDATQQTNVGIGTAGLGERTVEERVGKRFYGTVELDPTRLGRDAGRIAEEVVQHLNSLVDAKVNVTLEINANLPKGVQESTIRTILENCKTLKFRQYSLEDERG